MRELKILCGGLRGTCRVFPGLGRSDETQFCIQNPEQFVERLLARASRRCQQFIVRAGFTLNVGFCPRVRQQSIEHRAHLLAMSKMSLRCGIAKLLFQERHTDPLSSADTSERLGRPFLIAEHFCKQTQPH